MVSGETLSQGLDFPQMTVLYYTGKLYGKLTNKSEAAEGVRC
jgi:hypothetical protein